MNFTDTELNEFQEAYRLDYGEEITTAEAREMLERLVRFFELISRPLPSEKDAMQQDVRHLPHENESF